MSTRGSVSQCSSYSPAGLSEVSWALDRRLLMAGFSEAIAVRFQSTLWPPSPQLPAPRSFLLSLSRFRLRSGRESRRRNFGIPLILTVEPGEAVGLLGANRAAGRRQRRWVRSAPGDIPPRRSHPPTVASPAARR